jgi:hypothetical protein
VKEPARKIAMKEEFAETIGAISLSFRRRGFLIEWTLPFTFSKRHFAVFRANSHNSCETNGGRVQKLRSVWADKAAALGCYFLIVQEKFMCDLKAVGFLRRVAGDVLGTSDDKPLKSGIPILNFFKKIERCGPIVPDWSDADREIWKFQNKVNRHSLSLEIC